ncbi:hypothetical protein LJC49_04535 [Ruminococcaceae bacterium OttesenSCG-928-I18]|nr:hypothetical protein [Ruminococcaceae bacterium OttesenSCG-928-I18]
MGKMFDFDGELDWVRFPEDTAAQEAKKAGRVLFDDRIPYGEVKACLEQGSVHLTDQKRKEALVKLETERERRKGLAP